MSIRKYTYYLSSIWKLITGMKPWPQIVRAFLLRDSARQQVIELRKSGLIFRTRGVMDIWSIKETFLDRFYEKFGTPIGDGWTVIDVGGGIGDFTIFVAAQYPQTVVYTFEPTPESFKLLQENLQHNKIENVQAYPHAIWSQNGQVFIDTTTGEPGQFTSQPAQPAPQVAPQVAQHVAPHTAGKVIVPSLSLEEAFNVTGLARCNLLKIDCEGAEYEIIFTTPDSIFNRIERIVMEYHDGVTGHDHWELENFLVGKGYAVKTYPNYVHSYLGYLYASR